MTQPGTTGNAIPRGRDWIARDLADLRRMIRRLGAVTATTSGGVTGTAYFEAPSPAMGWNDFNTTPTITGDGAFAAYDSGSGGVIVTQDGYYQGNAFAQILYIGLGNTGRLKFSVPSLGFLEAFATDVDAGGLSITGPVRWQSAGDLFEVNTSLPSGSSGSPATDTDLCWVTLTRFGGP